MSDKKLKITLLIGSGLFFLWLQASPTFADPDSFYHTKMAVLMSQGRWVLNSFPWIQLAPFTRHFTDHQFLYHLILAPFVYLLPPLLGVKAATIILIVAAAFFFYSFLRRWSIRWPGLYLIILLATPSFVFRLNLAKTTAVSLIFLLIALSLIWQKRYRALSLIAFTYVWLYGGWGLLIILTGCSLLAELFFRDPAAKPITLYRRFNWRLLGTVAGGLTAGLIINPYFPYNLLFYWDQVMQIGLINYQNKILVGQEWYPLTPEQLLSAAALIIFLAVVAIGFFFWSLKTKTWLRFSPTKLTAEYQKIFTLLLFASLMGILTLKSQRFIEYFVPLAVLASAWVINLSLPADWTVKKLWRAERDRGFNRFAIVYLTAILIIIFAVKSWETRRELSNERFGWSYLAGASQWLEQNTPAGAVIFHANWSDFPLLFFHNDHNYYLAGLDPTFFYLYNPTLYKEWADISHGRVTSELKQKMINDFHTRYVLAKNTEKNWLTVLKNNPDFVLRYQDADAQIFEIR